MKKFLTIIFFILLGFSQVGYYIFSSAHQYLLKEEMREAILKKTDKESLTCISFSDHEKEIIWEVENKEFFFNNKMYDVVFSETLHGKIFLYCADDAAEKKLVSESDQNAKQNHAPGKKNIVTKTEMPVLFFTPTDNLFTEFSSGDKFRFNYCSPLHKGSEENNSPPPKA